MAELVATPQKQSSRQKLHIIRGRPGQSSPSHLETGCVESIPSPKPRPCGASAAEEVGKGPQGPQLRGARPERPENRSESPAQASDLLKPHGLWALPTWSSRFVEAVQCHFRQVLEPTDCFLFFGCVVFISFIIVRFFPESMAKGSSAGFT